MMETLGRDEWLRHGFILRSAAALQILPLWRVWEMFGGRFALTAFSCPIRVDLLSGALGGGISLGGLLCGNLQPAGWVKTLWTSRQ